MKRQKTAENHEVARLQEAEATCMNVNGVKTKSDIQTEGRVRIIN